ncbi:hypothetical protein, partial [Aeromonas media]|uniref:hypothetical protein n=1 Tax=Aeromonas media TaxID=651 RepID=UPI0038D17C0E
MKIHSQINIATMKIKKSQTMAMAIMPVMFFIPSFIFVFFNQYSLTSGVILSQFIVLSLTANRIP